MPLEGRGCVFCGAEKKNENIYICSKCVQRLLLATEEQLIEAVRLAKEKGYNEKAEAIENFVGMEAKDGETKKARRNMDRKRVGRKARSSR